MSVSVFGQSFFIPSPPLTEKNLPSQAGRVHIVTGGYGGCGLELCKILYGADAVVYVCGRSQEKADKAVEALKKAHPNSKGRVEILIADLSNLASIGPGVQGFLAKEKRLDVLTLNAGVMFPPNKSEDSHGHELQIGTNCLGSFLLADLLKPVLVETAKSSAPGSVRVTWAGSIAVDVMSPRPGGMILEADGRPKVLGSKTDYGQSKVGNLYLASEAAKRFKDEGVVHVCWNPGNLRSDLTRHMPRLIAIPMGLGLYKPIYGAYTELYAGLSPDITPDHNGAYIVPWGRFGSYRNDVATALKSTEEGGTSNAAKFWDWCERETRGYAKL